MFIMSKFFVSKIDNKKFNLILRYSQSYFYDMLKDYIPISFEERKPTQSSKYNKSGYTKVIFVDNKAYWITKFGFFTAELINGEVDTNTTKPIDTMGMDKVELDKISFIVDLLTNKDNDEDSNPRNK